LGGARDKVHATSRVERMMKKKITKNSTALMCVHLDVKRSWWPLRRTLGLLTQYVQ
jgi:hypothetical protein